MGPWLTPPQSLYWDAMLMTSDQLTNLIQVSVFGPVIELGRTHSVLSLVIWSPLSPLIGWGMTTTRIYWCSLKVIYCFTVMSGPDGRQTVREGVTTSQRSQTDLGQGGCSDARDADLLTLLHHHHHPELHLVRRVAHLNFYISIVKNKWHMEVF